MTDDQMFWEGRRTSPAPPQRLDSVLIFEFEPIDLSHRAAIVAACDHADAIGYQTTGGRLTVWINAERVAAMLRGLGTWPQPVRISVPPTTNLRLDEIELIRRLFGSETDIGFQEHRTERPLER